MFFESIEFSRVESELGNLLLEHPKYYLGKDLKDCDLSTTDEILKVGDLGFILLQYNDDKTAITNYGAISTGVNNYKFLKEEIKFTDYLVNESGYKYILFACRSDNEKHTKLFAKRYKGLYIREDVGELQYYMLTPRR